MIHISIVSRFGATMMNFDLGEKCEPSCTPQFHRHSIDGSGVAGRGRASRAGPAQARARRRSQYRGRGRRGVGGRVGLELV